MFEVIERPFEVIERPIETNLYLSKEIYQRILVTFLNMTYFDKDGFELNELEQFYHQINGIHISSHLYHKACQYDWFRQTEDLLNGPILYNGPILDHSMILYRYGYTGEALEQLTQYSSKKRQLLKLCQIKPKWGLDISIDWQDKDGIMELLHIEYDTRYLSAFHSEKQQIESIILNLDFNDVAKKLKQYKDKWQYLASDDQSDWKAKYLGICRAFNTLKAWE